MWLDIHYKNVIIIIIIIGQSASHSGAGRTRPWTNDFIGKDGNHLYEKCL